MFLRTLSSSTLVLSPLKTAGFLLSGIAVAIVITGCSSAESEKSETENQASSAAVASSQDQKAAVSSTKPESTTTETVPAAKTAMSPKETFVKFYAEVGNIKTYADYEAVLLKYGSEEQIPDSLEDLRERTEAQRSEVVSEIKANLLSSQEIDTIQESVNGSTATLKIMTRNGPSTITLVLENNHWKVLGL